MVCFVIPLGMPVKLGIMQIQKYEKESTPMSLLVVGFFGSVSCHK